jgi:hypothetical protein
MSRLLRAILITLLLSAAASAHAYTYVLSGGPSQTDNLGNDDVITIYVNNVQVGTGGCCNSPPITFTANPGDTLHVTVLDTAPVCYGINPLYLTLVGPGGSVTVLDPVGVQFCGESVAAGLFYDKTFIVPGPVTIPTLSEWGIIILSSLLALGAVFFLRRQR